MSRRNSNVGSKAPFAKKSLGQNFLVDKKAIERIANAIPAGTPLLLEIGPGRGALSIELIPKAEKLCVLEKDDLFAKEIGETLFVHGSRAHSVFHADALEFDWERVWAESGSPAGAQLSVCANLPYNVATEIFFRLLALRARIPLMVLMFQKEVAERLAAKEGSRATGALSVAAQIFYEVRLQQVLKPGAFRPSPKVESAVLEFHRRERPLLDLPDEAALARLMQLVRAAFAHRRKTLENSLAMEVGKLNWLRVSSKSGVQEKLREIGIDGIRRAESLTIAEFGRLYEGLKAV